MKKEKAIEENEWELLEMYSTVKSNDKEEIELQQKYMKAINYLKE